jgi:hypothetical protein
MSVVSQRPAGEPAPLGVGEEQEAGTRPGPKGSLHLGRVDAHHHDPHAGDPELAWTRVSSGM